MTKLELSQQLQGRLDSDLSFLNADTRRAVLGDLKGDTPNLWEVAKTLGTYANTVQVSDAENDVIFSAIAEIRECQGALAQSSGVFTTVVFGTSGWRGVIGEDFTVRNVHKVVRGITEMMETPTFLETCGYSSFDDVKQAGVVVFRDNRYMGDEFMDAAMKELARAGITIHFAGECPTGVGSALLTELGGAGSINFTPSHNPMEYAGLKFNPRDGGPADKAVTTIIEEKANAYMQEPDSFEPSDADFSGLKKDVEAASAFEQFIVNKSKVFDLPSIRQWMVDNANDFLLVVDFMHGSSRGYVQTLLGDDVVKALTKAGALELLNTNDDYSFHGLKPEPSASNQAPLIERLKASGRKYTLAVALDPDADRIRFADANLDIDMNRFGALAFANVLQKGMSGGIASTAPSSDFALEIAKQEGREVFEQAVGFKNFREPLSQGKAIVAFEESDGISFLGHTLEKCALAGFLSALDCLASQNTNLSEQYDALRAKYGYFYPDKAGADVKGVSVEEWQAYKQNVVDILQGKLYVEGESITVGGTAKKIASINTIDGLKLIFEDKSWILLRPSGTEPKFRYYIELADTQPVGNASDQMTAYIEAGGAILDKARAIADGK